MSMMYPPDEIEEEIAIEGEDDLQHLGEHWAEEAQALSSRQLSEALKICQSLRAQLARQNTKYAAEHRKLMETTAALTRSEALLSEERAAAGVMRREAEGAMQEKHQLEISRMQAQFDEESAKATAALAAAEEEKHKKLAEAAADKLAALRKAADESQAREIEVVATVERAAAEKVSVAEEKTTAADTARLEAEDALSAMRLTMAEKSAEEAEERKRLETEATQAALQYLQKVKAIEAEGEAKLAAEQAAHAETSAELADMTKIAQERAVMLEAAADAHRQLSIELQQLQDLASHTQATLESERAAHKKAKADWDELSRSALDEMFELRKRCAEAEAADQQQAYFTERLKELQQEQNDLVLSYGQIARSRSPNSQRAGSGVPSGEYTTPQNAY